MASFFYKAKKGVDQDVEGNIEANNADEALNKLSALGLFPVSITEVSAPKEEPQEPIPVVKKVNKKIDSRQLLNFTQKLTTLTRSKVELLSSLKIIYEQTENVRFQNIIMEMYNYTKQGNLFSDSLARCGGIFSPLYINIIKAGEASGRLDLALEQISDFLSREESLRMKVQVALAYPALLLFVGLSSIFVLINFVVPKLRPIFAGFGKQLPLVTKVVLQLSMLSNKSWWIILGIIAAAAFVIYKKKGSVFFKNIIRKIKTSIPILKRLTKNQELSYFSHALALLLKSGVPALNSLEIATLTIEDSRLRMELETVCRDIAAGSGISKSLQARTSLPNFFTKMIAVGEESGRLAEVLEEIFHSYTQQIELDITFIASLLEPILILIMGVVLGSIVLSILLPTFQITQLVR